MADNGNDDATQNVTPEAWRAAMIEHLAKEKAHTRAGDDLAAERRALPQLPVNKEYTFQSTTGPVSLADLFAGNQQLVIYHFMFGADWDEGCPSCSFWADSFNGTDFHLDRRNTGFACVSTASIDKLDDYRQRMGWDFPWVSSGGTTFNADFGVSPPSPGAAWEHNFAPGPDMEELPGLSVFARTADGGIALTYQAFARGLEPLNAVYNMLDMTAAGRDEDQLDWTMAWVERRVAGTSR